MWKHFSLCFPCGRRTDPRDGRGTSEKLSSSGDSEKYLPAEHDRGEGNVNNVETRSNAKTLSELPLARDRVINREEEEEEEKESLRRRICGRKTDEQNESIGRGDGSNSPLKEKQIGSTGRNLPCQQHTDSVESREEVTESPEVVPTEATNESGKEKEGVRREIQHVANVNNTETTDRTSNVSVGSTSKESDRADSSGDYQRQEVLRVPEIVLSKQVPECSEEKDALGEDPTADHANNIEHAVNFLSKELGADDNCLIHEEVTKDKLSEIVPSEATVELKEQGNCVLEEVPVVNNKLDIERFDDLSHNLHTDKVDISTRSSIENRTRDSALESSPKRIDEDETSNFGAGTSCALVDSHANEKQPKSAVVERFSDKLCKSVLDAVIHDKHLPPSKSEKETETENAVWRFSSILADSIVKTVLDYSKINQAHIVKSDENCNLAKNIPHVSNDNDEGTEDETVCELKSTGEGVCNVGKTSVDDASLKDLDEYAKKLSEQIISEVYQLNGLCHVPVKCSSTEVYASELTETILSDAIEGAKCSMLEDKSLNSIDRTHESSLDTFLDEIVGNVLKSVILRIAMEDQVEHARARGDGGNDQSECGYHGDENRNSGKFQSKWITEDDLDELHEDDLSEEEDLNANGCNSSDNLTKKETGAFWRKSLIQDLDDDLEFEELESQSSAPSSPTKSANFEMNEVVADSTSDDEEVYDTSPDAKVPTTSSMSKTYTSNRSRLRSVDSTPVLVFDNGSAFLKVGFSGEDTPKEIVPSVVGTPLRYSQEISGMDYSHRAGLVFGGEAVGKAGVLHIDYPLKGDVIDKWNDVEGLWNYVLGSLMGIQDNPDFPVLITQPALNSKKNTEKLAEIMFEHFHMPSLYIACQPVLALFSMGFTSGLSFCSGFNSTQAGVVYEGHVLPHTVKQLDIAGYQLTENLRKLLMSGQGFGFRSSSQWQIVNDIKEKMACVSQDFATDTKRYQSQAELQEPYELPDGQVIDVGMERFGCAESLFRPMELGLTQTPAHMLITEAINSCEEELQELCYKSIGISGGTTLMRGFVSRLELELRECDRKFRHFTAPEHRDLSTWLGGSIVASLPTFREMVVTVDEYADAGARVVHSKCF